MALPRHSFKSVMKTRFEHVDGFQERRIVRSYVQECAPDNHDLVSFRFASFVFARSWFMATFYRAFAEFVTANNILYGVFMFLFIFNFIGLLIC